MNHPYRIVAMLGMLLTPTGYTHGAQGATEAWFDEDIGETVPQASEGELVFLPADFAGRLLHSHNHLTITEASFDQGWVQIQQCYRGLDAVPEAEVVYRYRQMRDLRIASQHNIGKAVAREQSVQLYDVERDATLCVQAEARILYTEPDGALVLRNGPFHRRFLDGYFPLHVTLEVNYPTAALQFTESMPVAQTGFEVTSGEGLIRIDSRFAGTLNVELRFTRNPRKH